MTSASTDVVVVPCTEVTTVVSVDTLEVEVIDVVIVVTDSTVAVTEAVAILVASVVTVAQDVEVCKHEQRDLSIPGASDAEADLDEVVVGTCREEDVVFGESADDDTGVVLLHGFLSPDWTPRLTGLFVV